MYGSFDGVPANTVERILQVKHDNRSVAGFSLLFCSAISVSQEPGVIFIPVIANLAMEDGNPWSLLVEREQCIDDLL